MPAKKYLPVPGSDEPDGFPAIRTIRSRSSISTVLYPDFGSCGMSTMVASAADSRCFFRAAERSQSPMLSLLIMKKGAESLRKVSAFFRPPAVPRMTGSSE